MGDDRELRSPDCFVKIDQPLKSELVTDIGHVGNDLCLGLTGAEWKVLLGL